MPSGHSCVMNQLKQAHAFTLRNNIEYSSILTLKLLEIPDLAYAHKVFDLIPQPNLFLFNKLIQSYSSHGPHTRCFSLYKQIRLKGSSPNPNSFTFLFSACSSLLFPHLGSALHADLIRSGCDSDVFALTALVDMYGKLDLMDSARRTFDLMEFRNVATWNSMIAGYSRCGDMTNARQTFDSMPSRNVVSWTAMIAGFAQNAQFADALKVFLLMEKEDGVKPNEVTIASVLPACANLGALEIGMRINEYARRNGYCENVFVCNALMEMYAKCGRVDVAEEIFGEMGSSKRNLCSWNSMIMGLAVHGRSKDAVLLFHQMLEEGLKPDEVSFVGALMACTHGGMVAEGKELFSSMERDFNVSPNVKHYGCMVDLLGRSGRIHDSLDLIQSMPMEPDAVIWGALLGSCSFHAHVEARRRSTYGPMIDLPLVEAAERAAYALFRLEGRNAGNYVVLANVYASAGQWDGVARTRMMMKGSGATKGAGSSSVELGGEVHSFVADDELNPRCGELYSVLDEISVKMQMIGEEKTMFLCDVNDFV